MITSRKYLDVHPSMKEHPVKLLSPKIMQMMRENPATVNMDPFIYDANMGLWYTVVRVEGVSVISITPGDSRFSHTLVLSTIHAISDVMHSIFRKPLSASLIHDNFARFYCILDEVIYAGFPFILESNIIETTVPELPKEDDGILKKLTAAVIGPTDSQENLFLDNTITGVAPDIWWRRGGIVHHTNEFYVDVTDTINCTLSTDGKLISGTISGSLSANCKLSGNPELLLTFKNPDLVKNMISFHPSVRIPRWKRDTKLSFVPPDGPFTLAEYTITDRSKVILPFHLKAHVDDTGKISVAVSPRLNILSSSLSVENFSVFIKVPKTVSNATLFSQQGSVKFDYNTHIITWSIGTMKPDTVQGFKMEGVLRGAVGRISCTASASFRVRGWCASGVRIDSVNVTGVTYTPYKGVRYASVGGRIDVRI